MAMPSPAVTTRASPLNILQAYNKKWQSLPEDVKAGRGSQASQAIADKALERCKQAYNGLSDFLHPFRPTTALIRSEDGASLSHSQVANVMTKFRLPTSKNHHKTKPVVAVCLPNGPLLALSIVATATYWTCVPLAHGTRSNKAQVREDLIRTGAEIVLTTSKDVQKLGLDQAWATESGLTAVLVDFSVDLDLILTDIYGNAHSNQTSWPTPEPNRADDIAILLFTSGTSGDKKLVPLHLHTLVSGAAMVIESWGLDPEMQCLNQMPFNHVGGLVRNLFAPLFSGGSIICCPSFDANLFWDCVEDFSPTWYYASPTMHQAILDVADERPHLLSKANTIRLVCNAAGGLLPTLAERLYTTFSATVLPSYGMTECMPISTPPLDYRLDRTGTSGISVGPEIAILDREGRSNPIASDSSNPGRIAVRGPGVFAGYLKNGVLDRSCFDENGWFDTGDVGYLDSDNYLYITGRDKEVINRGGEIISPMEVENAVVSVAADPTHKDVHGRIERAMAFVVPHEELQEAVAIAVVTPRNTPRTGLKKLQAALRSVLAPEKIPETIVFMDDGLPVRNKKVLRVRMTERLGLEPIASNTPVLQRHFEADTPPEDSPLDTPIRSRSITGISAEQLASHCTGLPSAMDIHIPPRGVTELCPPKIILAPQYPSAPVLSGVASKKLRQDLVEVLPAYHIPESIEQINSTLPRDEKGAINEDALTQCGIVNSQAPLKSFPVSKTQEMVMNAFADTLGVAKDEVQPDTDFFNAGGDSMKAGRLLSALRKHTKKRFTIEILFNNSTVTALSEIVDQQTSAMPPHNKHLPSANSIDSSDSLPMTPNPPLETSKTCSSSNPFLMFLQLLPIGVVFPLKRALIWTVFIYTLSLTRQHSALANSIPGRLFGLCLSIALGRLLGTTIAPLFGIVMKWLIIGRYRVGTYPMWGLYHTRWWLAGKIIEVCAKGMFNHYNWSRLLYYRLMGVSISGWNVLIAKDANMGEFDLITIGDKAVLDMRCRVRPFAVEADTQMYLGCITIGANSSLGLDSSIAAGTDLPENACLGPNSSSWEVNESASEANRDLALARIPGPPFLLDMFLGLPIRVIVAFISALPWLLALIALVSRDGIHESDALRGAIIWFSTPYRVGLHYVALVASRLLGPIFHFGATVTIMKFLDFLCRGPVRPGPARTRSALEKLRMQLLRDLMPEKEFQKVSGLFGLHYEITSTLARLLGAKVGQRVYWPGTGPTITDWGLLEIGDDVVFGSRASLITSDGSGSEKIKIGNGAMVADRVVLLPGVSLGEHATMGSGALTRRNTHYPAHSTWVGSVKNEAVCLSGRSARQGSTNSSFEASDSDTSSQDEKSRSRLKSSQKEKDDSTSSSSISWDPESNEKSKSRPPSTITSPPSASSPFGRAFYDRQAPYKVWSQTTITLYSLLITALVAAYWNVASIGALQVVGWIARRPDFYTSFLSPSQPLRPLILFSLFCSIVIGILATKCGIALSVTIAAKRLLIGRREPGNYDWDVSSYCQRWQLFLKIEAFHRKCYGLKGILGLLTGTRWIAMYYRAMGARIGKDCAIFASGAPVLYFTEPDLLSLGNRVVVDDASLVGHINTRGKFDLNRLEVGNGCVLRSTSRLLSGATMEEGACLLEHTLVMAGEVVEEGATMQGWPAEVFEGERVGLKRGKEEV